MKSLINVWRSKYSNLRISNFIISVMKPTCTIWNKFKNSKTLQKRNAPCLSSLYHRLKQITNIWNRPSNQSGIFELKAPYIESAPPIHPGSLGKKSGSKTTFQNGHCSDSHRYRMTNIFWDMKKTPPFSGFGIKVSDSVAKVWRQNAYCVHIGGNHF